MDQTKLIESQKEVFNPETKSVFDYHLNFLEKKNKYLEERKKWRRKRK